MSAHGTVAYSDLYCSVCGGKIGKTAGATVINGIVCTKPICNYQDAPGLNEQRDAYIVAGSLAGVPASQMAFATGVSRQRIYQILDGWKKGI